MSDLDDSQWREMHASAPLAKVDLDPTSRPALNHEGTESDSGAERRACRLVRHTDRVIQWRESCGW
jgi:hypothetical protein